MDPGLHLDEFLWDFSLKIIPTDKYMKGGKKAVATIFKQLKKESRFPLDSHLMGRVGKKTSVTFASFDFFIFVNCGLSVPVLEDILVDFERILAKVPKVVELKKTADSVAFSLEEGYEMELIPAINFIPESFGGKATADSFKSEQAFQVLRRLHREPHKGYEYSSSLCETNLKFIREQPDFVARFARLARFWNRSLFMEDYISGRANTVELIAIYAAMQEKKANGVENPSMLTTFTKFLEMMRNMRNLRVEFPDFNPLVDLECAEKRGMKFGGGLGCVDPPYVMEPSNPYNNMLRNFDDKARARYEEFATATLLRLKLVLAFRVPSFVFDPFAVSVFAKYPIMLPMSDDLRARLVSTTFAYATWRNLGDEVKVPTIKFNRNEDKYEGSEMKAALRGMRDYLDTAVSTARSLEHMRLQVKGAINKIRGEGGRKKDWPPIDEYDVNLVIPCPSFTGMEPSRAIVGFSLP